MIDFIREFIEFLSVRKKYWLPWPDFCWPKLLRKASTNSFDAFFREFSDERSSVFYILNPLD